MRSNLDLDRRQLDRRLMPLRDALDLTRPRAGWVRAIRDALGMTAAQLGKRVGVSQSRIARIERDEAQNAVTLATLRRVAEGLNCTLVYALVPNAPLDEMARTRAQSLADAQNARTHHHMVLERQGLSKAELEDARERLAADILSGDPRRLWDEDA